jgi:hypothetical protein
MADVAARLYSHATESGMKVGIKEFNVAMEVKKTMASNSRYTTMTARSEETATSQKQD